MEEPNLINADQLFNILDGKEPVAPPAEPTTPPAEPPTTKSIEDYNKLIAEKFGYNTIDDLLDGDAVSKVSKYDEVSKKLTEYEAEMPMLFEEFQKTGNPFASEAVFKLNHLQKTHPELDFSTAVTLVNTDLTQMKATDALLLSKRLSEPELTEKQAQKLLAKDFGFDTWTDLLENEDAEQAEFIDAKAAKAKKDLSKYNVSDVKYDASNPVLTDGIKEKLKTQRESKEQAYSQIEEKWKPLTDGFEANFNEFPIAIETKDKKVETISKIILTAEDKKLYSQSVIDYVKGKGYSEVNESNVKDVQQYLADLIILSKYPAMTKIAVDKAVSDAKVEWEKSKFNPSGGGAGEGGGNNKAPEGKTGVSIMDAINSQVKREMY